MAWRRDTTAFADGIAVTDEAPAATLAMAFKTQLMVYPRSKDAASDDATADDAPADAPVDDVRANVPVDDAPISVLLLTTSPLLTPLLLMMPQAEGAVVSHLRKNLPTRKGGSTSRWRSCGKADKQLKAVER